ncbi:hypothetical protein QCA50_002683 [Cerrena zonata]|uniref:DUF6533 domain-containing protein n=1 Tax=Cerrena zonata TaxID=2478898 RepID=A0AAW0GT49_9APHY
MAFTTYSIVIAHRLAITSYLHIAISIVWLWDALTTLSDEFRTFQRADRRIRLPDVIYPLSRIITGSTVLGDLIHTGKFHRLQVENTEPEFN